MPSVLAVDQAKHFGWAFGQTADRPESGHDDFTKSDLKVAVFSAAQKWMYRQIKQREPTIVVIEQPAYLKGENQMSVHDFLHSLCAHLESGAFQAGHFRVHIVAASTARKFFLPPRPKGAGRLGTDQIKLLVRRQCIDLGWVDETKDFNTDQTDALCLWAYGVSLIDPEASNRFTPLFQERLL